jgi:predicted glycogen debranching enzyme
VFEFNRSLVNQEEFAAEREWLVTNGIGGFSAGTIAGVLTRRYHGLLIAALAPPLGRTLLVSRFDDEALYAGEQYILFANSWSPDAVSDRGFEQLDSFRLEGTTPVWRYALGDALLEKRIWMGQGANTTYVRYDPVRGGSAVTLKINSFVNYRDYHGSTHANGWQMKVTAVRNGLCIQANEGSVPFYLLSAEADAKPRHTWYHDYHLAIEAFRGLEDREDHLLAGEFRATLHPNAPVTFVLTTEEDANLDGVTAYAERQAHEKRLWQVAADQLTASPSTDEDRPYATAIRQLVLAADQFIVARPTDDDPDGRTVIAGYPWFGDWGRDTMIALPGLTLVTGRPEVARRILRTFGRYVDRGMLPNRFPDHGDEPEYNTVDATLWYFEALRSYHKATGDDDLVCELFPILQEIIKWHRRGTRYSIHQDEQDGLLFAGEPGVQLTWMDAKVGEWVVTPRVGKPVEVNALWYNALCCMATFADIAGDDRAPFDALVEQAQLGFARFWNPEKVYCYDVLDGPHGHEATLRPNQLLAVSLPHSPLTAAQQKGIVDACARHLLTPHGLRSLARHEDGYVGRYDGPPAQRDGAYHQGTVWAWLIGPFVAAHFRVYADADQARSYLLPLLQHLGGQCVGTISEIFDGDAPFAPRGAFAQAWSVAEVLRAWWLTRPHRGQAGC